MISIVIPVYNEEENIPTLYNRIVHAAEKWGDEYEVVMVDDGSSDESLEQLEMIHQRDPRWKVLSFSRNFGHQTAVSAGIFYCHGDVVATMDADLQDPLRNCTGFWKSGEKVTTSSMRSAPNGRRAYSSGVLTRSSTACCVGWPRLKFPWMRVTSA